jgi:hypothetical protein
MSRPKKQIVDYFPHSCEHGKTMFILEERYGNNGYSFWFKLLEILGGTEGHAIDLKNESELEYLRSKTRCEEGLVTEMLDLLAKLDAIDRELWGNKVVWSDNFVNGISDVYTRFRHTSPPCRPDNYAAKPHVDDQSTQINPQSKVKESKVKKSKEEVPDFIPEKTWEEYLEMRKRIGKPLLVKSFPRVWSEISKLIKAGDTAEAILNQSIISSWQGVFAVKKPFGGNNVGIRTARSDPGDKNLQSKTDAEVTRILAGYAASQTPDKPGRVSATDDAPDFQSSGTGS